VQLPDLVLRDWKGMQRIVESLLSKPEVKRGQATVNFSASTVAEVAVPHNLGKTPVMAGAWPLTNASTQFDVFTHSFTRDTFTIRVVTTAAITQALVLSWVAAD
jgi:hypothetical protein